MTQFILDALRGAAALLFIFGAIVLIIWLVIPGMDWNMNMDAASRSAAKVRTFNAMFGGVAIIAMLAFGLMAYGANH